jgi:hypothetical protein
MTTVYIDRDNKVVLRLEVDGIPVASGIVTKVVFWIPGDVTVDGNAITLDSSVDPAITLTDSNTVVELDLGGLDLKRGSAKCYLTAYDAINTDGIAWDTIIISFDTWKP